LSTDLNAAKAGDLDAAYNYACTLHSEAKETTSCPSHLSTLSFEPSTTVGPLALMIDAIKWYKKAAEMGYAQASYNLGLCYATGERVEKNIKKAAVWYMKAAKKGHMSAQYNLALCYDMQKQHEEAARWYTRSAAQGHKRANQNLSIMYQQSVVSSVYKCVSFHRAESIHIASSSLRAATSISNTSN